MLTLSVSMVIFKRKKIYSIICMFMALYLLVLLPVFCKVDWVIVTDWFYLVHLLPLPHFSSTCQAVTCSFPCVAYHAPAHHRPQHTSARRTSPAHSRCHIPHALKVKSARQYFVLPILFFFVVFLFRVFNSAARLWMLKHNKASLV